RAARRHAHRPRRAHRRRPRGAALGLRQRRRRRDLPHVKLVHGRRRPHRGASRPASARCGGAARARRRQPRADGGRAGRGARAPADPLRLDRRTARGARPRQHRRRVPAPPRARRPPRPPRGRGRIIPIHPHGRRPGPHPSLTPHPPTEYAMQRRTTLTGAAVVLAVTALVATGCAAAPDDTGAPADTIDFLPCAASDLTGFDDGDFNELSYNGVKQASEELGSALKTAESAAEDQYTSNIASLVDQECDFIVTVGFALANATRDSARENPEVKYALIDSTVTDDDFQTIQLDNVKPVLFDTAQAAVLAGYLAAGASQTGKVGTFGGMPFPSVTIFMDGFADGVAHYNKVHGTSVQLFGWDKAAQNGTFLGSFDDQLGAKTITAGLIDQGADIIMPVAGNLYMSSVEALKEAGGAGAIIGVNSDVY